MKFMTLIINDDFIRKCNFKGRGGKENEVISCFLNNLIKENGILYDCIDIDTKKKYELKKQKNDQWLDPSKFFNLSNEDKEITMVFILYDKNSGLCDMVATISLGNLIKIIFTEDHLKSAESYAKKFPKDQIKSGIKIKDFIKNNKDSVKIIWKK
jgi:hypothetical protein